MKSRTEAGGLSTSTKKKSVVCVVPYATLLSSIYWNVINRQKPKRICGMQIHMTTNK